jgi:Na+/glutamate symporter
MSGSGFHVHGPHDHEMEHAAHGTNGSSRLAVATAVLATVGAIFSYMGGYTQANAGLFKNNAAIKKTEAANQWNYYQAKSSKQNLAELSTVLVTQPEAKEKYRAAIERYQTEKEDIKGKAEALEKESTDWDHQSEAQMHQHHRWSQATTMLQVAIALAAIALLTRRDWMEYAMFGLASVGLVLGGMAYLHL